MADYPTPPFSQRKVPMPGRTSDMTPRPDHGEESYKGSGKLEGLKAGFRFATEAEILAKDDMTGVALLAPKAPLAPVTRARLPCSEREEAVIDGL